MRDILAALVRVSEDIPTVCIGGISQSNALDVLGGSAAEYKPLDGIAVVSAIVASPEPEAAARELRGLVESFHSRRFPKASPTIPPPTGWFGPYVRATAQLKPISHNMTNLVVQNLAANVALAVGASPIMSNYAEEAADLAKLRGALVINMGTVTPEGLENYVKALRAYNQAGLPVVLDPVG